MLFLIYGVFEELFGILAPFVVFMLAIALLLPVALILADRAERRATSVDSARKSPTPPDRSAG